MLSASLNKIFPSFLSITCTVFKNDFKVAAAVKCYLLIADSLHHEGVPGSVDAHTQELHGLPAVVLHFLHIRNAITSDCSSHGY